MYVVHLGRLKAPREAAGDRWTAEYLGMENALFKHLDISRTIGIPFDFSSDFSSGHRPTSKSEEKSKGIPIVLEIV